MTSIKTGILSARSITPTLDVVHLILSPNHEILARVPHNYFETALTAPTHDLPDGNWDT
ncbi:MAG: hypothetical protein LBJ67_18650 [Planctomycetaceae bacterium]|nr:hypothetical protein [Planctomycetaceae bacterium]